MGLHNMAMQDINIPKPELEVYSVQIEVVSGHGLPSKDLGGKSDPFVKIKIGNKDFKTKVVKNNLDPIWNTTFSFQSLDNPKTIAFTVLDEDITSNDLIGQCQFDLSQQFGANNANKPFFGELQLKKKNNKKNAKGTLKVRIHGQKLRPLALKKIADQQKETIFKQNQQIDNLTSVNTK